MPGNLSDSPFKVTRDRQGFQETLNMTTSYEEDGLAEGNATIEFNMTVVFELPNYRRGNSPGPPLRDSPIPNYSGGMGQFFSSKLPLL